MLQTVEGFYRNGRIELAETPAGVSNDARVLVTFMAPGIVNLPERGINEAQAAELRARLASFADDWESTEMADYDDYDANRRKLQAG
jgi:hypothetical protein